MPPGAEESMPKQGTNPGSAVRSRTGTSALDVVVAALAPEALLRNTPYRDMWRESEARLVVLGSRAGLLAAAVGLVLHHFFVDLPLHKAPEGLWLTYRFGGAAFFLFLFALTFAPVFRRLPWARLPVLVAAVVLSTLEAKAVEWSPTVSYFWAFILAAGGVLLLRQSILGVLGSYGLCVAVQWALA